MEQLKRWAEERFATKEDIKRIEDKMATKEQVEALAISVEDGGREMVQSSWSNGAIGARLRGCA